MRCRALFLAGLIGVGALFGAAVPRPAPDFSMRLPDGTSLSFRQYRGKVLLMAFIKTTCPHCQAATKTFEQLQNELGPRGFQVLEAAVEDDAKDHVAEFEKNFQTNFPVGVSDQENAFPVLRPDPKKLILMPQCVLLDRKGLIRAQFSGDDAIFEGDAHAKLRSLISRYLGPETKKGVR